MEISGLPRGFSTCCLRFTSGVATTHAKLASGWLARLYREGVEPSGPLQKVSDHILVPLFWIYPGARRTYLHLSCSYAAPYGPALLVTQDPYRPPRIHSGLMLVNLPSGLLTSAVRAAQPRRTPIKASGRSSIALCPHGNSKYCHFGSVRTWSANCARGSGG